ncbi:sigma-54 dependent transcriptional regulator [Geobacter sp. SVR]|uniref:sigma-54-dependent transcriptional regulator n=1 Tax=Geobacter sp. SVR TaxID=2495594 RepID=UPI00143EFAC6|nr:sigma-54 dependent transcriptional regulator [Geobacter sp. SVR]BCS53277.1 sigma-54-dependent Fis family transcriptional regulator [Geobacter sp. SVR]GCF85597.1 sigma-54-dependent Fis family transcriptional regulator [Geobacter sp. SVR]
MQSVKILIVDDEPLFATPLKRALENAGFGVRYAENGSAAVEAIHEERFDILLEDLHLPDAGGLDILKEMLTKNPECKALVMTGFGTIENAVEAMKIGAFDFLTKPFSLESLLVKLQRVLNLKQFEADVSATDAGASAERPLVARSKAMQEILKKAGIVAGTDATVMITGESGTGKELLTDFIHAHSARRDKDCVKVNCAAIPESLLESELFGAERGAYTDAHQTRKGYIEMADKGTLFLDEVGELPLAVQAKLLRALDERTIYRVGGNQPRRVDFRLVVATNRDLHQMVEAREFRSDLFYRLNVVPITIPPLRERREDIPLLIAYFVKLFKPSTERRQVSLSPDAFDALCQYNYPGNIRELKNIIEQISVMYPGEKISRRHLIVPLNDASIAGALFESFPVGKPLKIAVAEFEKRYIEKVMRSVGGRKSLSAKILGLSRKVLWERINRPLP